MCSAAPSVRRQVMLACRPHRHDVAKTCGPKQIQPVWHGRGYPLWNAQNETQKGRNKPNHAVNSFEKYIKGMILIMLLEDARYSRESLWIHHLILI